MSSKKRQGSNSPQKGFENPIMVVGEGRCGTSAVAGILHHLGVFMGEDFVPPNHTNVYGHWEDIDFHDLTKNVWNEWRGPGRTEKVWIERIDKLSDKRRKLFIKVILKHRRNAMFLMILQILHRFIMVIFKIPSITIT